MNLRRPLLVVLALTLALLAGCGGPPPAPPGVAMPQVNLVLFQGRWYEIASNQPWSQEGCVCTRVEYLLHGQELVMQNTCRRYTPQGEEFTRTYLAEPVPGTGDAQLTLHFRWPFRGGYWVIGLDPDYLWALVGSPDRRSVWVLAREPRLDPGLLVHILEIAKLKSYDTSRVRMTEQSCGR